MLAAGRATRLGEVTGGRSKLLLRLGGVTLVERAVRMLLAGGLERVVVVVGYEGHAVAAAAKRADPERVNIVRAERWELGNGESLAAAETLPYTKALPFAGASRTRRRCLSRLIGHAIQSLL